ncbi:MAG: (2,3-dihydroxybenzoyl)adenylate synthase [Mycobacteriaceae bacterium]
MAVKNGFIPFDEKLAQGYREAGYWQRKNLSSLLTEAAELWPERSAVFGRKRDESTVTTYAELDLKVNYLASDLIARGIEPGDRIVFQFPNIPEFITIFLGIIRAGAVPVMCLPAHRELEISHLVELSEAVGYIIADTANGFDYRRLARSVQSKNSHLTHILVFGEAEEFIPLNLSSNVLLELPEVDPESVALLLVSGGTTGLPKLIPRTHQDYFYNIYASSEVSALTQDDVYLVSLPAAHNFPLGCPGFLGALHVGGAVAFTADPSPENAFSAIEKYGVTVTAVVPPIAQLWCTAVEWENFNLSTLRLLQVGGSKLDETTARNIKPKLGTLLQQVFGMAEGLLNYTRLNDPEELIMTTQGRPLSPADEVRIVDEEGCAVPLGAEGELLTRGPYTTRGYYKADKYNSYAVTDDGFYRSGDIVRQLSTGHLIVIGRIKDVINRGGENVSCEELEEHLLAHQSISSVAVVGVSDDFLGEKICAAIVTDGLFPDLAEIRVFLAERGLATYKLPDQLFEVEAMPVTAVGKIDRRGVVNLIDQSQI